MLLNNLFLDLLKKVDSLNDSLNESIPLVAQELRADIENIREEVFKGLGLTTAGTMQEEYDRLHDPVNHPQHYTQHPSGIECIEITRHYPFSIGNAIKYLWRAGLKKSASLSDKQKEIEDLKKSIWYINDRIKQLQNDNQ